MIAQFDEIKSEASKNLVDDWCDKTLCGTLSGEKIIGSGGFKMPKPFTLDQQKTKPLITISNVPHDARSVFPTRATKSVVSGRVGTEKKHGSNWNFLNKS